MIKTTFMVKTFGNFNDLKDKSLASTYICVCRLCKKASLEEIECALCEAKDGPLAGILDVTSEQVVSSDFIGSPFSCTYDRKASLALNEQFVKLLAWSDTFNHQFNMDLHCYLERMYLKFLIFMT